MAVIERISTNDTSRSQYQGASSPLSTLLLIPHNASPSPARLLHLFFIECCTSLAAFIHIFCLESHNHREGPYSPFAQTVDRLSRLFCILRNAFHISRSSAACPSCSLNARDPSDVRQPFVFESFVSFLVVRPTHSSRQDAHLANLLTHSRFSQDQSE